MKLLITGLAGLLLTVSAWGAETASGRLGVDDLFRLGSVSEPRVSPEGDWIAYTVERSDLEKDETKSRIWMVPAQGGEAQPLTAADQSSSWPRWSPDGRYLAFISARGDAPAQVWRLSRNGGEAVQLTDTPQAVEAFEWSPDSSRMLLLLQDPTPAELAAHEQGNAYEEKTRPPWVIDRRQFKLDYVGYLDRRRRHVYVLDLQSETLSQLTHGDFDASEPVWSPDGGRIAYTSNRTEEPDSNYNTDIWVISADPDAGPAPPLQITQDPGPDESPAWSPDGRLIAHTSRPDTDAMLYATVHLAVSAADGSGTRLLTEALDRMVSNPSFSTDGSGIWFLLEDAGEQNLARISPRGGDVDRVVRGQDIVYGYHVNRDGRIALRLSRPQLPFEIFLLGSDGPQQRSFVNRDVLAGLQLGAVEKVRFNSADGTPIESFAIKPPGFVEGKRYPAILDIHGGPQAQYDWSFSFEAQLYAANGYLVVHPNPRGSTGYGQEFCMGIWQDWGGPDFEDVMAAVDDAIDRGWADPDHLAVTGWSYGGILTNHVITKTDRFDAAISGASEFLYVVNYGHDQYQRWWEQEMGLPWEPEARAIYERMSPFNRVENVVTPTLVIGGEEDWNVPIINSEQLYLALKRLGVDTQLVVYPGEHHGIATPSYVKDLYERYLGWFARYLE